MKKIILNERQENMLLSYLLSEETEHYSNKEELILQWLKNYFKPMDLFNDDEYGIPQKKLGASILTQDKQVSENLISAEELFRRTQAKFKKILIDTKERDQLIKNAIKKWYKNKA